MTVLHHAIEHRGSLDIERVTATTVSVPATRTCTWAFGRSYGHTRTIVQVYARGGLVGIGEAPGDGAAQVISGRFAPKLVGISALEHQTVRRACLGLHRDFGYLADPSAAIAYSANFRNGVSGARAGPGISAPAS